MYCAGTEYNWLLLSVPILLWRACARLSSKSSQGGGETERSPNSARDSALIFTKDEFLGSGLRARTGGTKEYEESEALSSLGFVGGVLVSVFLGSGQWCVKIAAVDLGEGMFFGTDTSYLQECEFTDLLGIGATAWSVSYLQYASLLLSQSIF